VLLIKLPHPDDAPGLGSSFYRISDRIHLKCGPGRVSRFLEYGGEYPMPWQSHAGPAYAGVALALSFAGIVVPAVANKQLQNPSYDFSDVSLRLNTSAAC
jgi:hypothetical protein